MTCPGEYNIVCDDVGSDFDKDVCECDGQMWVSADCKEAFLCNKGRYLYDIHKIALPPSPCQVQNSSNHCLFSSFRAHHSG